MGKLAKPSTHHNGLTPRQRLARLTRERRKLASRLSKLDQQIAQVHPSRRRRKPIGEDFDRWFNELTGGKSDAALPVDWSRADLYDDHD